MAMDVKEIRFYVLDVGQGACNYVEIVNSHDVVIHNMLIDLGTSSRFTVALQNVAWLNDRIKDRPDPRIDVLLLTHGDNDHYNLVSRLAPSLNPPSTTRIGMVRYGGVAWRYRANKDFEKGNSLIKALKNYCTDVNGLTDATSDYNAVAKTWTYLWPATPDKEDPKLAILVANVPHAADGTLTPSNKHPNGVAVNTKSIVYGLGWKNQLFLGTGDATAYTFNTFNTHFEGVVLPPVPMMTMPHHGSKVTTYDLAAAEHDPHANAVKVIDTFMGLCNPHSITISANEATHFHPSLYTLNQFSKYTGMEVMWMDPYIGTETHFLTAYVDLNIADPGAKAWPDVHMYATVQTDLNLYSTLYYVADWVEKYQSPPVPADTPFVNDDVMGQNAPARGKNWRYTLNANGNTTLEPWDNPHPATTIHAAFVGVPMAAGFARTAAVRPLAGRADPPVAMSRAVLARHAGLAAAFTARRDGPVPAAPVTLTGLRPIA